MNEKAWQIDFRDVWDRAVAAWKCGKRSPTTMFERKDILFLNSIGCTAQELFDFVDDALQYGDLDFDTTLAVAAIRREYFLTGIKGKASGPVVPVRDLPAKSAEVDGIAWLPRLIAKARIKLRGELNPDLMYGCAGDRPFLRGMKMTLPQFLKLVWESGDDDRRIINEVKRCAGRL